VTKGVDVGVMRWVRAHRQRVGCIALFALALQLVLSFGHVHREDFAGALSPRSAASLSQSAWSEADASGSSGHGSHAHDICAICATVSLTSTSLPPPPVVLPAPPDVRLAFEFQAETISLATRGAFHARGPPRDA
jgi:hypothetical protein